MNAVLMLTPVYLYPNFIVLVLGKYYIINCHVGLTSHMTYLFVKDYKDVSSLSRIETKCIIPRNLNKLLSSNSYRVYLRFMIKTHIVQVSFSSSAFFFLGF